jgi:hypothetical protein
MKDLSVANFILGMEIKRDWENHEAMVKSKEICRHNIIEV